MTTLATATALAEPVGRVGSWFYFTPSTAEIGQTIGLDVVGFYALGRGGVMGDLPVTAVTEAFYFFKPSFVESMYAEARARQAPEVAVPAHLAAADVFARATFGAIPEDQLRAFAAAAAAVVASAPEGRWPLVDGYRRFDQPDDAAAAAYRQAILLRELRGGVHIDAVRDARLMPVQACYLDNGAKYFALHGFTDDDVPEVDDDVRQRRADAEADTDARMAALLGVLDEAQQQALVTGALAMRAALKSPVPVGG